jgi:hypothetical protein
MEQWVGFSAGVFVGTGCLRWRMESFLPHVKTLATSGELPHIGKWEAGSGQLVRQSGQVRKEAAATGLNWVIAILL